MVKVKYGLLKNSRVFEQFLYQVYYTMLKQRHFGKKLDNHLIHACGVSKDGEGYIFTGPSESGKSTIANLSNKYAVLNDEIVIVGKNNGSFKVSSTLFNGEFKSKINTAVPLKAVFYLRHGKSNLLNKLRPAEFVKLAAREIIMPTSLLSLNSAAIYAEMVDFSLKMVSDVPCYELYFLPHESVWEYIEKQL